ncbi:SNF2 family N-terminal domain-containing protein [Chaetomium sp. MPI-CAGE-AT-0009]|nr:SNF2 family N-terminal domain-containing protein [Chaetomium sp. MPI-CAGE-AT-0009]
MVSQKRPYPFGNEQPRDTVPAYRTEILDVKAQLRHEPPFCHDTATAASQRFGVCQYGAFYALESSGAKFAVLNKKICHIIRLLLSGRELQLHAFVAREEWTRVVQCWMKEGTSTVVSLDLNIYGYRQHASEVGRALSTSKLFLQQPIHGLDGFIYYNPHYLHADEILGSQVSQTPLIQVGDKALVNVIGHEVIREKGQQISAEVEIDSILNSLSHHNILGKSIADRRIIKTTMLDHQAEALDFIVRREIGKLPPETSLWRRNQELNSDSDEDFFEHIIVGARSVEPKDTSGGILADDMGLGKSLVILSTIAGTLDRANTFVSETQGGKVECSAVLKSRSTLVIAPSSLLIDNWIGEIRKHTYSGYLTFHKHHGQGRQDEGSRGKLLKSDIVLTTYATIASEFRRNGVILGHIQWFRIVLDEAHDIRNRTTKQYQAVTALRAKHRWCLTGTPIQNSVEDLGALVSFLRLPILENTATFRKFIASPSTSGSGERFNNLRVLLGSICLRRKRELVGIPDPTPQVRLLKFSPSEQEEYDNIQLQCRREIDMAVSGQGNKQVKSTVLRSLLKLRLFCNNGTPTRGSGPDSRGTIMDADETLSYLQQNDEADCAYCFRPVHSISDARDTDGGLLIPGCQHLVCRGCMPQFHAEKSRCPRCTGENLDRMFTAQGVGQRSTLDNAVLPTRRSQYPSKLLAFLSDISTQLSEKTIAFSSWNRTLSLMGELLSRQNIPFYCIHGSLSLTERIRILKDFRASSGANILLMTFGTGAVGLNLSVATRIYLMEPQWNPSIELQAIGRALRLGQKDQVAVVRYIIQDSVENSNVLFRQETKLQLAGGGFEKHKRGIQAHRLQSLLGFFGATRRPDTPQLTGEDSMCPASDVARYQPAVCGGEGEAGEFGAGRDGGGDGRKGGQEHAGRLGHHEGGAPVAAPGEGEDRLREQRRRWLDIINN